MKHVKLFESWMDSEDMGDEGFAQEAQVATCFQGDAFAAVGVLDEVQQEELQAGLDALLAKYPEFGDLMRIENVDVTGMAHVLHDVMGRFTALPAGADQETSYPYHIAKSGENIGEYSDAPNLDEESRLFDLVQGAMLVMDHHGATEKISVSEFVEKYLG